MQTCFVVMGFGTKTDYRTGRPLDLDKTYKHIIKPAVEASGVRCVRADDILHSGTIDVPMYEELLAADLVVADLSTANVNAAYELGVRHALRPYRTVIIAEEQFELPFDVNHLSIMKYRHDGKALDIEVALEFRNKLQAKIDTIMKIEEVDSPVYTFLRPLVPPVKGSAEEARAAVAESAETEKDNPTLAMLMEQVAAAKARGDFQAAKALLEAVHRLAPKDPHVIQQLALVTYKSRQPTALESLEEAKTILNQLHPLESNDPETLGLWGAVHKRLWELSKDRDSLDRAVSAHEKGFSLLGDYYNGINYAFLLNTRATVSNLADAIADFVLARRVRKSVLALCEAALAKLPEGERANEERYWLLASQAEAAHGLGDDENGDAYFAKAKSFGQPWMVSSTVEQLDRLRPLLQSSPIERLPE